MTHFFELRGYICPEVMAGEKFVIFFGFIFIYLSLFIYLLVFVLFFTFILDSQQSQIFFQ
jgi:hypothetical protein